MKSAAALLLVSGVILAQDPRIGLKPGFRDAGVAARNMTLIKSLPKPDGFFDPKNPAGIPTPPEPNPNTPPAAAPAPSASSTGGLNFVNSDLTFSRERLFVGNFSGF